MTDYAELLASRAAVAPMRGLDSIPDLHPGMFHYQRDVAEFLLACGRGAAFLDTGLGKSLVSLEWGRVVAEHTGKPVLMLAPLAVAPQHVREASKFDLEARIVRDQSEVQPGVNVTNYAKVDHFDPAAFGGIILDESSIIKNFTGAITHTKETFPVEEWQDYAAPVWNADFTSMPETDVLNVKMARSDKDEKHLCPMPLNITRRALRMWSNPGDVVFSPFMGIGSEGVVSLEQGRKFIGTELGEKYFGQAVRNLRETEHTGAVGDLFGEAA